MAYTDTYSLSRGFTLNSVYTRTYNLLAEPSLNITDPGSIVEAIKYAMVNLFNEAREALRDFYVTPADLTFTSGVASLAALPFIDEIMGLTYLPAGASKSYRQATNLADFMETTNPEMASHRAGARLFWLDRGKAQVRVKTGADVTGENTLELVYVRTPMIDFTYAEVIAGTIHIDIPDTWVPYIPFLAGNDISDAMKMEKTKELRSGYQNVVNQIEQKVVAFRERRKAQNKN